MLAKGPLALTIALILGAASVAKANDHDKQDHGGFDIGPRGQCFVPPDCDEGRDQGGYRHRRALRGFAYAPEFRYRHRHDLHRER
jgi:hypothetical protein